MAFNHVSLEDHLTSLHFPSAVHYLCVRNIQSNFPIKDNMGTPVLSIVEKLSLLGNHFLTVYLIFNCTKCIRLYEVNEK